LEASNPGKLTFVGPDSVWEIVFLMVILKIPIAYLCFVVYYAIKAEPKPEAGASVTARLGPDDRGSGWWSRRRRGRRPRPHGGPSRSYPRSPRTAYARTQGQRR
jgi:hypothetical protein